MSLEDFQPKGLGSFGALVIGHGEMSRSGVPAALVYLWDGVPDETSLAGVARVGEMLADRETGTVYVNTGTLAAPVWAEIGGGGGPATVGWDDITGKPAVIAAGADAAGARTAIGAGTSSVALSSTAPAADAAAAAVGSGTTAARADHVHAFPAQLATARAITLTGDVTGTANFDGSAAASITAAIGSGVIVNDDVNVSAAIARTKLAAHGVAAVSTADVATTDDWTADGAAVVALVNELKAKINSLISAA